MSIDDNKDDSSYHSKLGNGVDSGQYNPEGSDRELSNRVLQQQTPELKRTKGKLCKNGCGSWIYLQEDGSGRWQPYNQDDNEFHRCSKRPSKYRCHNCGNNIAFDQDKVSKSGKPIPLNESDLLPHQCPNDPFNIRR